MAYMRDTRGSRLDVFDPARDLPRIIGWWDYSQLTGAAGTSVRKAVDKSGLGHTQIEATLASQGTVAVAEDGKKVFRSTAATRLACQQFGASYPIAVASSPVTVAALVKASSSASTAGTFPNIYGGLTASTVGLTLHGDSGIAYGASRASTTVSGPTIKDDAWHVLITVVDSGAAMVYVDGQMTSSASSTAGTDTIANVGTKAFAGDIREAMVVHGRLTTDQVTALSKYLAGRAPTSPTISAYPRAAALWEATTSSNGQAVRVFEPETPATPGTLVIFSHQQGGNEQISPGFWAYSLFAACNARGWHAIASNMHGTDSWGNDTAIADLLDAYNLVNGRFPISNVILVGASMGGVATLVAASRGSIPNIKGAYLIDGVCDLASMYSNASYTAGITSAYSIVSGTLSAAMGSTGLTSVPTTASFPTVGTKLMIGNGTGNVEIVTTTAASTGTSVAVTATTKTHASGEQVSDFPTRTAANNPSSLTMSTFAGKRLRFQASSADTTVLKTANTDAMITALASNPTEASLKTHGGVHLTGVDGTEIIPFIQRCVS